jgi:hypothetical protein
VTVGSPHVKKRALRHPCENLLDGGDRVRGHSRCPRHHGRQSPGWDEGKHRGRQLECAAPECGERAGVPCAVDGDQAPYAVGVSACEFLAEIPAERMPHHDTGVDAQLVVKRE